MFFTLVDQKGLCNKVEISPIKLNGFIANNFFDFDQRDHYIG